MGYGWQIGRLNFWFSPSLEWRAWTYIIPVDNCVSSRLFFCLQMYAALVRMLPPFCKSSHMAAVSGDGHNNTNNHFSSTCTIDSMPSVFYLFICWRFICVFGFHSCGFGCMALLDFNNWWLSLIRHLHLVFRVLLVSPNLFLGGNKQYRVGVCLFYCILWSNGKQFVAHGIKFMQVLPNSKSRLTLFHQHTLCTLQQTVVKRRLAEKGLGRRPSASSDFLIPNDSVWLCQNSWSSRLMRLIYRGLGSRFTPRFGRRKHESARCAAQRSKDTTICILKWRYVERGDAVI
jgi:hypothetical protein